MGNIWLELGVIVVVAGPFGLLLAKIVVETRRDKMRQRALEAVIVEQDWTTLPARGTLVAAELAGSVLGAFRTVFESHRVLATVKKRLLVLSQVTVDRPTHVFSEKLTLAEFEMAREAPHILIVPQGSRFIGPASLVHDYHLRPQELEGQKMRLYVPEGFEIEALEVLEPDVWAALAHERVVVELNGPSARFMWPNYLPAAQMLSALERAAGVVETLYGVAPGELANVGRPSLEVSRTVRVVSNLSLNRLAIGGGVLLGLVCATLLVLQALGVIPN